MEHIKKFETQIVDDIATKIQKYKQNEIKKVVDSNKIRQIILRSLVSDRDLKKPNIQKFTDDLLLSKEELSVIYKELNLNNNLTLEQFFKILGKDEYTYKKDKLKQDDKIDQKLNFYKTLEKYNYSNIQNKEEFFTDIKTAGILDEVISLIKNNLFDNRTVLNRSINIKFLQQLKEANRIEKFVRLHREFNIKLTQYDKEEDYKDILNIDKETLNNRLLLAKKAKEEKIEIFYSIQDLDNFIKLCEQHSEQTIKSIITLLTTISLKDPNTNKRLRYSLDKKIINNYKDFLRFPPALQRKILKLIQKLVNKINWANNIDDYSNNNMHFQEIHYLRSLSKLPDEKIDHFIKNILTLKEKFPNFQTSLFSKRFSKEINYLIKVSDKEFNDLITFIQDIKEQEAFLSQYKKAKESDKQLKTVIRNIVKNIELEDKDILGSYLQQYSKFFNFINTVITEKHNKKYKPKIDDFEAKNILKEVDSPENFIKKLPENRKINIKNKNTLITNLNVLKEKFNTILSNNYSFNPDSRRNVYLDDFLEYKEMKDQQLQTFYQDFQKMGQSVDIYTLISKDSPFKPIFSLSTEERVKLFSFFKKAKNIPFNFYINKKEIEFYIKLITENDQKMINAIAFLIEKNKNYFIDDVYENFDNENVKKILLHQAKLSNQNSANLGLGLKFAIKSKYKDLQIEPLMFCKALEHLANKTLPKKEIIQKFLTSINKKEAFTFNPKFASLYINILKAIKGYGELFIKNLNYKNYPELKNIITHSKYETESIFKTYCQRIKTPNDFILNPELISQALDQIKDNKIIITNQNIRLIQSIISQMNDITHNETNYKQLIEENNLKTNNSKIIGNTIQSLKKLFPNKNWEKDMDPRTLFSKFLETIIVNNQSLNINNFTDLSNFSKLRLKDQYPDQRLNKKEKKIKNDNLNTLLNKFNVKNIDLEKIIENVDTSFSNIKTIFTPINIEKIRYALGEKIGYKDANDFIIKIAKKILNSNNVNYNNIKDFIEFGKKLRTEEVQDKDANDLYELIGNFTINKVSSFLDEELDVQQKNKDNVDDNLIAVGSSLEEIQNLLQEQDVPFFITKSTFQKLIKNLKDGNLKYIWKKMKAKFNEKISINDKNESKNNIEKNQLNLPVKEGVTVESITENDAPKGTLFTFDPKKINTQIIIGTKEEKLFDITTKLQDIKDPSFIAPIAFTAANYELTGYAIRKGEALNARLSKERNDAMIIFTTQGKMKILDKRTMTKKDIYNALEIPLPNNFIDKKILIAEDLSDNMFFENIMSKAKASLVSSLLLIKDGVLKKVNSKKFGSRRILIEYENGNIGIFNSSEDMSTHSAISIVNKTGKVKSAAYMDTGSYNVANLYLNNGKSRFLGTEFARKQRNVKSLQTPLSNMIVLSKR